MDPIRTSPAPALHLTCTVHYLPATASEPAPALRLPQNLGAPYRFVQHDRTVSVFVLARRAPYRLTTDTCLTVNYTTHSNL